MQLVGRDEVRSVRASFILEYRRSNDAHSNNTPEKQVRVTEELSNGWHLN